MVEKKKLLGKIEDLELQKTTLEENKKQAQEQEMKLREQISSLTTALEEEKEQQVNLQPFKEHVLAQKAKMLQLQTAIEEERCKVLQIDG